jgi:cytochrome b6-f complex iron-sulfur subunit
MNAHDDVDVVRADSAEPPAALPVISRRTAIRRLGIGVGLAAALGAAELWYGATLWGLYPSRATPFGGTLTVGRTSDFPAATPQECELDKAGVFYRAEVRAYIVHLSAQTDWLLGDSALADALRTESIQSESDGSIWLALYQACPHRGTTVDFLGSCHSFKCPSHGAHFHCDGEYLDGPGPRSMDRFPISFEGANVIVDTGRRNQSVGRPGPTTRLLAAPGSVCFVG